MLRSSIDLGTNTCLLLLGEWDSSTRSVKRVVGDYSTIVRLGEGVDKNRSLGEAPRKRTLDCLKTYAEHVKKAGLDPKDTVAVATSSVRDSNNGAEFFAQIAKETGFQFRLLSGDDEAKYTFLGGLLPGMNPEKCAVIDIGGGSTEFMSITGGQSIDMGSVRFTERFLKSDPATSAEFEACVQATNHLLEPLVQGWRKRVAPGTELVAVAGTATTLAAWQARLPHFDAAKIDQLSLSVKDLYAMATEFGKLSVSERARLPGMEAKRADVILAGAIILWRSVEVLGFSSCRISSRGLRYGILGIH